MDIELTHFDADSVEISTIDANEIVLTHSAPSLVTLGGVPSAA